MQDLFSCIMARLNLDNIYQISESSSQRPTKIYPDIIR